MKEDSPNHYLVLKASIPFYPVAVATTITMAAARQGVTFKRRCGCCRPMGFTG